LTPPATASARAAAQNPAAEPAQNAPAAPERKQPPVQKHKRTEVGVGQTKVTTKTVRRNSKIEIVGVAKNRSGDRLAGLNLRLRYGAQPVNSRSQLDQIASGPPSQLPHVGPQQQLGGAAEPAATQRWTFRTDSKALPLDLPS